MIDLSLMHYYLGIEVRQGANGFSLCQGNYAKGILEKAGLKDCNPCKTPMEQKMKLSKDDTSPLVDATFYSSLVGSLRYLVNTSPDISFTVGYVSRFMWEPHADHLAAVKHILRYIAGTWDWGLFYQRGRGEDPRLVGYSDNDWAGDLNGKKSTTGLIFLLGGSVVCWQSMKHKIVAMSSCEAEYVVVATTSWQAVWLARLLSEILNKEIERPILKVDNKSTLSIIRNPVLNERSRHIDTRFHLIREHEATGQVNVQFIETKEQLGDILTKPLGRVRLLELSIKIGVYQVK
jgi:hypothetical protein